MEEKLKEFRTYLKSRGHRPRTINSYAGAALRFTSWVEKERLEVETLTYSELLKWVGWQQGKGLASRTINQELIAINKLYASMNLPSPAGELRIRGQRHKLRDLGGLLSVEELLQVYENYEAGGLSGKRNKAILGMLIWQGLRRIELERLREEDVDMQRALIRIPETAKCNSRILDLPGAQIPALQDYLYQVRPLINIHGSDRLFVSMGSGEKLANSLSYLLKHLRKINPRIKTLNQIRQSVITVWLDGYDIRTVQYMAGHKNVSSTQRYKGTDLASLQERIERLHPLNES